MEGHTVKLFAVVLVVVGIVSGEIIKTQKCYLSGMLFYILLKCVFVLACVWLVGYPKTGTRILPGIRVFMYVHV